MILSEVQRDELARRLAARRQALRAEVIAEDARQPAEDGDGHVRRRLVVAHHVEVVVRPDPEQVEHRVEQLAVLRRDADAHVEPAASLELFDHGGELDGLGTGAEDCENLDHLRGRVGGSFRLDL